MMSRNTCKSVVPCDIVVIATVHLHSNEPELSFSGGSNSIGDS